MDMRIYIDAVLRRTSDFMPLVSVMVDGRMAAQGIVPRGKVSAVEFAGRPEKELRFCLGYVSKEDAGRYTVFQSPEEQLCERIKNLEIGDALPVMQREPAGRTAGTGDNMPASGPADVVSMSEKQHEDEMNLQDSMPVRSGRESYSLEGELVVSYAYDSVFGYPEDIPEELVVRFRRRADLIDDVDFCVPVNIDDMSRVRFVRNLGEVPIRREHERLRRKAWPKKILALAVSAVALAACLYLFSGKPEFLSWWTRRELISLCILIAAAPVLVLSLLGNDDAKRFGRLLHYESFTGDMHMTQEELVYYSLPSSRVTGDMPPILKKMIRSQYEEERSLCAPGEKSGYEDIYGSWKGYSVTDSEKRYKGYFILKKAGTESLIDISPVMARFMWELKHPDEYLLFRAKVEKPRKHSSDTSEKPRSIFVMSESRLSLLMRPCLNGEKSFRVFFMRGDDVVMAIEKSRNAEQLNIFCSSERNSTVPEVLDRWAEKASYGHYELGE